jgi:hypothetical protein
MDFCLKRIEIVVWNFEELKKELGFYGFLLVEEGRVLKMKGVELMINFVVVIVLLCGCRRRCRVVVVVAPLLLMLLG